MTITLSPRLHRSAGISRQGVLDTLKRAQAKLMDMEGKLGLVANSKEK